MHQIPKEASCIQHHARPGPNTEFNKNIQSDTLVSPRLAPTMDSQLLVAAALGLVVVALYFRKDSTSNPRRLPPPPGPKPDPIVRLFFKHPQAIDHSSPFCLACLVDRQRSTYTAHGFMVAVHGMERDLWYENHSFERVSLRHLTVIAHVTGDIVHLQALGQHIIVINSYKVASELLGQKLAYADRPAFQMIGELCVFFHPVATEHAYSPCDYIVGWVGAEWLNPPLLRVLVVQLTLTVHD